MPKVSVILTSFNHEKFLRESIESVLNQTYRDFDLFIWDDASTDNSWEIIQSYRDSRIRAYRNSEQRRAVLGINKSVSELARSEYIAIHHSDDVWEPEKLAKQVAFLDENPSIGAVFTNALAIDEEGNSLADENHFYKKIFEQPNRDRFAWLNHFFYHGNALCHPSILIRKECYEKCGCYRYGFAQIGDFDMWIRLCLQYEIHVLSEQLVRFRVLDNEANTSGNKPVTHVRGNYEFYQLLGSYLHLTDPVELIKVFPDATTFNMGNDTITEYVIARLCIDKGVFPSRKVFGLNLLFTLLNEPETAGKLKSLYAFTYSDYIALTGKEDLFRLLPVGQSATTTIFWDNGSGYSADCSTTKQIMADNLEGVYYVTFNLNYRIKQDEESSSFLNLRWDPLEGFPSRCKVLNAQVNGQTVEIVPINSYKSKDGYDIFLNDDPIYTIKLGFNNPREIIISYQVKPLLTSDIVIYKNQEIEQKNQEIEQKNQEIEQKNQEIEQKKQEIELITTSVSWRITKPIRNLKFLLLKTFMLINRMKRK